MLIKFHYNWLLIYFLLQKFLKNSWRKYVLRLEWNDFLHYANAKINYCSLVFIIFIMVCKYKRISLLRHFQMKFVCGQWIVTTLHAFFPLYGHNHVWVVKFQHIDFIINKSIKFLTFELSKIQLYKYLAIYHEYEALLLQPSKQELLSLKDFRNSSIKIPFELIRSKLLRLSFFFAIVIGLRG